MKAVIFDMDGVLIDSEPLWRKAEQKVFAEIGLELSEADCELTMGKRSDEVISFWLSRSPWIEASAEEVELGLTDLMTTLIAERGEAMAGVAHALSIVRHAGLATALASSSPPELIQAVLRKLDLDEAFSVVRSATSEESGKPHPAVFLAAADELGLPAGLCTVIEDSPAGVRAGLAAGMRVIAVPPPHLFEDPAYDEAVVKLASLESLTRDMLI